jgi:pyruvate/2-oxoglutarate dehydrogenase complex dihydrolipoamide dehydrogenase (E3) component
LDWTHDVVVVGAGAAGLTAAGGCARLGLRVALIERDRMGGECLHTGCVPSKALLAAAHRAQAMRGTRLGVTGPGPVVDFAAVRAHIQSTIVAIAPHDSEARFAAWGVEVIWGEASLTGRHSLQVGGRTLSAPRIVLATGSDPAVPAIPGLTETPFLTNETVFALDALPDHLVVVGGGSIGVELAQAFCRLGAGVTLLDSGAVLGTVDTHAALALRGVLEADGVTILDHIEVTAASAEADGIRLDRADGPPIRGSHLLVVTGRRARLEGLGLDRAGVATGPDGVIVDHRRRTTNKAIFAIGDCRAGPRFTHAAGYEGTLVVTAIGFGLPSPARFDLLPAVIYTAPELAQLGATEQQARARHQHVRVSCELLSDNDRAVAEGDTTGFVKLVRTDRRVVGVTILGCNAGDMLLPWSLALLGKASLWTLAETMIAYPTRSELSKAAAFASFERWLFGKVARRWAHLLAVIRRIVPAAW